MARGVVLLELGVVRGSARCRVPLAAKVRHPAGEHRVDAAPEAGDDNADALSNQTIVVRNSAGLSFNIDVRTRREPVTGFHGSFKFPTASILAQTVQNRTG